MDLTITVTFAAVFGALVILCAFLSSRQRRKVGEARQWPQTEATVESEAIEVVGANRYGTINLPTFGFSYKVGGEYYSDRFSLRPPANYQESLLLSMAGRNLLVHYNPERPEEWLVHDDFIEGCRVLQKIRCE